MYGYPKQSASYTVGGGGPATSDELDEPNGADQLVPPIRRADTNGWLVRLVGIEPTAIRLKVECSTTELQAREEWSDILLR